MTLGLLGACLYFVVGAHELAMRAPSHAVPPPPPPASVQIVDVGHGVAVTRVPWLVQLDPDERVAEVDGRTLDRDDAWADQVSIAGGRYVDLTVERTSGRRRRVLVLSH